MSWIRRHIQTTVWLALAALVVQLTVTFGHVHAIDDDTFGAVVQIPASDEGGPGDHHSAPGHHLCDICTNIGLLGTSALPVVLKTVPFRTFVNIEQLALVGGNPSRHLHGGFEARAPPTHT